MTKKKTQKDSTDTKQESFIRDEIRVIIYSIVCFVFFTFFILAAFDKAGVVGRKAYSIFSILFGLGYYLLPTVFFLLAVSFAMSVRGSFTKIRVLGASIFFISCLALLDLAANERGGMIGNAIHKPLVALFDSYASAIILGAIALISLLVILDARISFEFFKNLFARKTNPDDALAPDKEIKISTGSEPEKETVLETKSDKATTETPAKQKKVPEENEGFSFDGGHISFKPFNPPPLSLLERDKGKPEVGDIKANANIIKRTLLNFGIVVEMDEISIGPSVTRYALKPAEGVKLSKILGLQNNLELALAAHPVRIEAPIPGKSLVGIEIPNSVKTTVGLASLLSQNEYVDSDKPLLVALGKGISGSSQFANLAKMPHLLIAGATGSGKSVTIHVIINSMLFRNSAENLKFIMIDPKRVELTMYNKIPHLLTPVITDAKKAIMSLKWAAKEMDRRYDVLEKNKVRDIDSYHKNILYPSIENAKSAKSGETVFVPEPMPYIVIIIDELADIMQAYPRELESAIIRLAQMSRAVGIHLILSTQRPSVNVITGLIKANIPTRIALQVASQFDSRTILDSSGAEKLLGAGDMLYLSGEMSKPIRLQSPYISETELKKVAEYLAKQNEDDLPSTISFDAESPKSDLFGGGEMTDDDVDDDLYEEARDTVIQTGKASTSYLQRKLRIGYARAARLIDILEEKGVISGGDGAKPREVLIKSDKGPAGAENTEEDEI